jgi:hypothetical protein
MDNLTSDMLRCAHATIKRRGNRAARWWTCATCKARWQRIQLDDLEITPAILATAATSTTTSGVGGFVRRLAEATLEQGMQD